MSLATATAQRIAWENWDQLWPYLGFTDRNEMESWLKSDFFQPYFQDVIDYVIVPAQKAAGSKPRPRGPTLRTVQAALMEGEKMGRCKYSALRPNKDGWNAVDHYAYFIYCVKSQNLANANGIFFGKGLNDPEIYNRIWSILKRMEFDFTPSRAGQSRGKKLITPAPVPPHPVQPNPVQGSKRKGTVWGKVPKDPARPADLEPARLTLGVTLAKPSPGAITEPIVKTEEFSSTGSGAPGIAAAGHSRTSPIYLGSPTGSPPPSPEIIIPSLPPSPIIQPKLEPDEVDDRQLEPGEVVDISDDEDAVGTAADAMTQVEIMEAERTSDVFDLKDRFWQRRMIRAVTHVAVHGADAGVVIQLLNLRLDDNAMGNAMSDAWRRELGRGDEQDLLEYAPFTEESARVFDMEETLFNNTDYQREDLEEACAWLGITNMNILRIPGMPLSKSLQIWQPVAAKAINDFFKSGTVRACVLADMVGLGKTWIVIIWLMTVLRLRNETPIQDRGPAKPAIIVVPLQVLNQWIEAFEIVAPRMFTVYKYYGAAKNAKDGVIGNEKIIRTIMNLNMPLFDSTREENARAVVFTVFQTFAERHGPRKQATFRKSKGWSSAEAKKHYQVYDKDWPLGLQEGFGYAILDEAHMLKNMSTDISTTIMWLNAKFYIMLTATPMPNGIEDFKGFMPFIQPANHEELWSERSLHQMGVQDDIDPYSLPDDHPAAILRLTAQAGHDFIFRKSEDPVKAGVRVAKIWRECLIRRGYASRIPFNSPTTIGSTLPRIHGCMVNCAMLDHELQEYKLFEEKFYPKLVNNFRGKMKWSFGTQRQLSMQSTWKYFEVLERVVNIKAATMRKWVENPKFVHEWIIEISRIIPNIYLPGPENNEAQLAYLCEGSPKLRVFLKNIADQTIRDQEKAIVWCMTPAIQMFLYGALKLCGVDVVLYAAHMSFDAREHAKSRFNNEDKTAMVLILPFALGSHGMNIQWKARRVHIFEPPNNDGTRTQAIGRSRRVGSPFPAIYVYEYYTKDTFDDQHIQANIRKAIPGAMAELNQRMYRGEGELNDDSITLGNYVKVDGALVPADSVDYQNLGLRLLDPAEILGYILTGMKGERMTAT